MDIKAYIESGILELYVAGALSEKESKEVYDLMLQYPEIKQEVLEIESAIVKLTAATSQKSNKLNFETIKVLLNLGNKKTKVVPMVNTKYNWLTYLGWAASLVLGAGLLWMMDQNEQLENTITNTEIEKSYLELQIEEANTNLAATKNLLNVLRDKEIISVPLAGQGNFANTFAKVYWDKKTNRIYLDAQGLPEAPAGKVYQVWSLTLNPLTPTSLGTIDDFNTDDNKIFAITNANESQAFGITLEPEGGSDSPTMEQLYTLGVVASGP
jgi:anti-sigma-K factor RskA